MTKAPPPLEGHLHDPNGLILRVTKLSESLPVPGDYINSALNGANVDPGKDLPFHLSQTVAAYARERFRNDAEECTHALDQIGLEAASRVETLAEKRADLLTRMKGVPDTLPNENAEARPWTPWSIAGLVALLVLCILILFLDALTIQNVLTATRASYAEHPWVAWMLSIFLGVVACSFKIATPHVPFLQKHEGRVNLIMIIVGVACLIVGGGMTLLSELGGNSAANESMDLFASSAPVATGLGTQAIIGRCLLIVAAICAVGVFTTIIHRLVTSHGKPRVPNSEYTDLQKSLTEVDDGLARARRELASVEPLKRALNQGVENYCRRCLAALYEQHAQRSRNGKGGAK